jgi:hypothetical protein
VSREYEKARTTRSRERQEFRTVHPSRRGRPLRPYPETLSPLPEFADWLTEEVNRAEMSGQEVPEMVKDSAKLPSVEATAFRAMKAHGMHLRIRSAEEDKRTCDSSIAASFLQPLRGTESSDDTVVVPVEYIGWIDEILELNYGGHCIIVLLCSRVKASTEGTNATVKRDEYGFTLAKVPRNENPVGPESFAFPINVQQVFFSDKDGDPDWKVVCRVDVRSRRSPLQFAVDDNEVLGIGRDDDFQGLNRDYGDNCAVPGEVPEPQTVFVTDISPPVTRAHREREVPRSH